VIVEDQPSIEELEARLRLLTRRAELVARMALRLRSHKVCNTKGYLSRIGTLIKELDLSAEALNTARAEAQEVAASLNAAELVNMIMEAQNAGFSSRQQH